MGETTVPEEKKKKLAEVFGWLNDFLAPTGFAAGTASPTVADICLYACYSNMVVSKDSFIDFTQFANIQKWAAACKAAVPHHDKANEEGCEIFRKFMNDRCKMNL